MQRRSNDGGKKDDDEKKSSDHVRRGARLGAGVGAGATGAAGATAGAFIGGFAGIPFFGIGAVAGAAVGGAIGGLAGLIVGSATGAGVGAVAAASAVSNVSTEDDELRARRRDMAESVGLTSNIIDYNRLKRIRSLGQGSFARVFQGKWQHNNREQDVAIKELLMQNPQERAEKELLHEASVMMKLQRNDNVVKFCGICVEPSHLSLVMEYVPKGSLYQVLQEEEAKAWPWNVRLDIALGISRGLEHLHNHQPQILHRDLKSLNVLLDGKNVPKITDFGLSQIRTETSTLSIVPVAAQVSGVAVAQTPTPAVGFMWMAPELMLSIDAEYSRACDIFSLGVILWEIASCCAPWSRPGRNITYDMVRTEVAEGRRQKIPERTPPFYAALIGRCWAQRAAGRPKVDAVVQELVRRREIPLDFLCPITLEIMREAVIDRKGHSFDKKAIETHIEKNHNCPIGREPLELTDLQPNYALRGAIEGFLVDHPHCRDSSAVASNSSTSTSAVVPL